MTKQQLLRAPGGSAGKGAPSHHCRLVQRGINLDSLTTHSTFTPRTQTQAKGPNRTNQTIHGMRTKQALTLSLLELVVKSPTPLL